MTLYEETVSIILKEYLTADEIKDAIRYALDGYTGEHQLDCFIEAALAGLLNDFPNRLIPVLDNELVDSEWLGDKLVQWCKDAGMGITMRRRIEGMCLIATAAHNNGVKVQINGVIPLD